MIYFVKKYSGKSARRSVNSEVHSLQSKPSQNEILEKLLALLTTDVQDLANSLWEILDNDKVLLFTFF